MPRAHLQFGIWIGYYQRNYCLSYQAQQEYQTWKGVGQTLLQAYSSAQKKVPILFAFHSRKRLWNAYKTLFLSLFFYGKYIFLPKE